MGILHARDEAERRADDAQLLGALGHEALLQSILANANVAAMEVGDGAPPPLMTDEGILLLYNGADDDLVYASGQALIDADDPTHVVARSEDPFLEPSAQLEYEGQVPNVVFIEGLVRFQDRWFLYYGMGDSGIGVALSSETE